MAASASIGFKGVERVPTAFLWPLVLTVLSMLMLARAVGAEDSGLVAEIFQAREGNKNPTVDVSDIVRKYIPVGTPKHEALTLLTKNGFRLYFQPPPGPDTDFVIALLSRAKWFAFGDEEIHISIVFKGQETLTPQGRLILRAP